MKTLCKVKINVSYSSLIGTRRKRQSYGIVELSFPHFDRALSAWRHLGVKYLSPLPSDTRAYLGRCQTSMMEIFARATQKC